MSDLDVLKDIPGYKAILKSVLKSQIQLLIEQLADQTGEESIILTASINDGTLSHLGSSTGKGFLDGRDEMKSQFLGYCLKTHHKLKTQETKSPSYQRTNQRHMPYRPPQKRQQVHPVLMQRARTEDDPSSGIKPSGLDASVQQFVDSESQFLKQEGAGEPNHPDLDPAGFPSTPTSFPSSLQLSHTQTSTDLENSGHGHGEGQGQNVDNVSQDSEGTNDSTSAANIKIEPITENEMELEITGVEPGNTSLTSEDWGQAGYGSGADGDSSLNQSADASSYSMRRPAFNRAMFPEDPLMLLSLANKDSNPGRIFQSTMPDQSHSQDMMASNKRLHECSYCGKSFTSNSLLVRHIRIHTGEKPYVCSICSKSFNQKVSLRTHIGVVHYGVS